MIKAVALLTIVALLPAATLRDGGFAPVRIGISNAQTGTSSFLGTQLLAGSQAYFDLINTAGGVYGHKIEIVLEDDGYEPEPAVANTYDLISKHQVFFLFDYVGTPTLTRVLPLLRYYANDKIINVAPLTGAGPQRKPPYDRFVFNIRASYAEETEELVQYLWQHGFRRVGFLGQADAFGKSGETSAVAALAKRGLGLHGIASYRRNQAAGTSMREQVNILRRAGADSVIVFAMHGPCASFIRDARSDGWDVPIASVSLAAADALLSELKQFSKALNRNMTDGLLVSQVVPPPNQVRYPLVAEFRKHVAAENAGFIGLEGWLNAVVAVEALQRMGPSLSRDGFIKALESLGGWDPGVGSRLNFSATSHTGLHRVWLTKADHDTWVEVQ